MHQTASIVPRGRRPLRLLLPAGVLAGLLMAQAPTAAPPPAMYGFLPAAAARELQWERQMQALPQAASLRASLERLTAQPHGAGTAADHATALYVASVFRRAGLSTRIVRYSALLPQPLEVRIELVQPHPQPLANYEAPIPGDRFSAMKNAFVGFNAYSPSGDVTAPVVYANYGLEDDYAELKRDGISVRGKIVLVRYGRSYRGIKSELAALHGAAGCLIYSDPNDDGFHAGNAYPAGSYRPPTGIQRGSILNNNYPGAPLKPGEPLPAGEAAAWKAALPTVPTAPLSYSAAEPILAALAGRPAPRAWQGGLPFTYHLGGSPQVQVHMRLRMDFSYRTIWDVIGQLDGRQPELVLVGNHRDAWTFGAVDPNSGTMVLLELARALGKLHALGWQPRRTLRLCSWDAEEYALIGSTDYAERHLAELHKSAVAYINMDEGDFGPYFSPGAVPSMRRLIYAVARAVPAPPVTPTGSVMPPPGCQPQTVYDLWQCQRAAGAPAGASAPAGPPPIGVLGGGSDFEPFLDYAGLASADISFAGPYGVYHSLYDDFHYFRTQEDPHFDYAVACTRVMGLLAMRLAGANLLPLDVNAYATAIGRNLIQMHQKQPPGPGAQLNWAQTEAAATRLETAARDFSRRAQAALANAGQHPKRLARFNTALADFEQTLQRERGLPGRPFYRNLIYAPEITRGYATARLPGVSQMLEQKNWLGASVQLRYLYEALQRAAIRLQTVR